MFREIVSKITEEFRYVLQQKKETDYDETLRYLTLMLTLNRMATFRIMPIKATEPRNISAFDSM